MIRRQGARGPDIQRVRPSAEYVVQSGSGHREAWPNQSSRRRHEGGGRLPAQGCSRGGAADTPPSRGCAVIELYQRQRPYAAQVDSRPPRSNSARAMPNSGGSTQLTPPLEAVEGLSDDSRQPSRRQGASASISTMKSANARTAGARSRRLGKTSRSGTADTLHSGRTCTSRPDSISGSHR